MEKIKRKTPLILRRISHYIFRKSLRRENVKKYIARYLETPHEFFDNYIQRTARGKKRIDDVDTISPNWKNYEAKYHYNLCENGIIDSLMKYSKIPFRKANVLDIGSGSGHWISFYLKSLEVSHITGVDFCESFIKHLNKKFCQHNNVEIIKGDISNPSLRLNKKYNIINAIGVMFHIVDDTKWETAVSNFSKFAYNDAILIVGGVFGRKTFIVTPSINESGPVRKVRSINLWKRILHKYGFQILEVKYYSWFKGWNGRKGIMNNLLICKKTNI